MASFTSLRDGRAEIKANLGKNIKFLRANRQFSQADLAEKAGISITFLSNIERGLKYPKPDILWKIAKSLEVEIYELFKTELILNNNKELISRLSEDINGALESVFKQYLG